MPTVMKKKQKINISGLYHIILRGINRQIIFENEEDNEMLLQIKLKYKEKIDCII